MKISMFTPRSKNTVSKEVALFQGQDHVVQATKETPYVKYNKVERSLCIRGRSTGKNMNDFYAPFIQKSLRDLKAGNSMKVELFFQNINTSTVKVLFDMFKAFRTAQAGGAKINVLWICEMDNEAMLETGADLSELYGLPFQYRIQ